MKVPKSFCADSRKLRRELFEKQLNFKIATEAVKFARDPMVSTYLNWGNQFERIGNPMTYAGEILKIILTGTEKPSKLAMARKLYRYHKRINPKVI